MKKSITRFIGLALVVVACNSASEDGIKVSGKVENKVSGELAILSQLKDEGFQPVDTIDVKDNGEFVFYAKLTEPTFFRINFFNRQTVSLILDGTEDEITMKLDGNKPNEDVIVEGSPHTKYLKDIEGLLKDHQVDVQELNQMAIQARMNGDQAELAELTDNYYTLVRENQNTLKKYIWNITPSLAAFYGLQSLNLEENYTFFDSVATKFEKRLPGHPLTDDLKEKVASARKLAVGAEAPEVLLPTPEGDTLSLSSLRGNYVLIDFWAGWCKPCRAENPNVVKIYQKYSNKNFEILGISLDRNKEAWLSAIQQDRLPWKHVSDLKYFNSQAASDYQISAIPATYLIDPDGKIIAKGLRGPSLEAKLKEIFG